MTTNDDFRLINAINAFEKAEMEGKFGLKDSGKPRKGPLITLLNADSKENKNIIAQNSQELIKTKIITPDPKKIKPEEIICRKIAKPSKPNIKTERKVLKKNIVQDEIELDKIISEIIEEKKIEQKFGDGDEDVNIVSSAGFEDDLKNLFNEKDLNDTKTHTKSKPRIITIEYIKSLAEKKEGVLLSEKYTECKALYIFKCKYGHVFQQRYDRIEQGSWCKTCKPTGSIGEALSLEIMKTYFNCTFKKAKPKWLNGLELDIYNSDLKLAVEYDGAQHYKFNKRFHKTSDAFKQQQERDIRKNILCEQNGVTLIRVPYTIEKSDIANYIKEQLSEKNINIPNNIDIDYRTFTNVFVCTSKKYIDEIKDLIKDKNATLLSDTCQTMYSDIEIKCNNGHAFKTNLYTVKYKNSWCGLCGHKGKFSLDELNCILKSEGIQCTSTSIINFKTEYNFSCNCGYEWKSTISKIRKGERCHKCYPEKIIPKRKNNYKKENKDTNVMESRINTMLIKIDEKVKQHNGIRLSSDSEYKKATLKLKFQCVKGHIFEKTPAALLAKKTGTWCHACATNSHSINDMQLIAQKYGGVCLSTEYVNLKSKLIWKCSGGHKFVRTPACINDKKTFCLICK